MSPATAPLAAWLEAHGLRYGIAGYWDASIVTLQSGNRVQIRAVDLYRNIDGHPGLNIYAPGWETNALWYDASRYDATFAVANSRAGLPRRTNFEHFLASQSSNLPGGKLGGPGLPVTCSSVSGEAGVLTGHAFFWPGTPPFDAAARDDAWAGSWPCWRPSAAAPDSIYLAETGIYSWSIIPGYLRPTVSSGEAGPERNRGIYGHDSMGMV